MRLAKITMRRSRREKRWERRAAIIAAKQMHCLGDVGRGDVGLAERMFEDAAKGEIEDGGPDEKDQHK
jgi:hypothetical protein